MLGLVLSSHTRLGLRASTGSSGTKSIFYSYTMLLLTSFTVQDPPWVQQIRNSVRKKMGTVDFWTASSPTASQENVPGSSFAAKSKFRITKAAVMAEGV